AFDLYATFGLPFEITRDIAQERGLDVDESGFWETMDIHRLTSGGGQAMGEQGGDDAEIFQSLAADLKKKKQLKADGVHYDPYSSIEVEGSVLGVVNDGKVVAQAKKGDQVSIVLGETCFYVAAGGQVSDQGTIVSVKEHRWVVRIDEVRRPAAGVIAHSGVIVQGTLKTGDKAIAAVDRQRRQDIMRNHTATHLLHAELHAVVGDHARQAGSLVAPDRLRFDFTHSEALTAEEISKIEAGINRNILDNYELVIEEKSLEQAKAEGAMALFGEKYGEIVRTISIGGEEPFSYELCGGTHVRQTGDIGTCLIVSEGSVAAGIRRIEAITGRAAYDLIRERQKTLAKTANLLSATPQQVPAKVEELLNEQKQIRSQIAKLMQESAANQFKQALENTTKIDGAAVLTCTLPGADIETLRLLADRFKQKYSSGAAVLVGITDGKPNLIAVVSEDLVTRGLHAGDLVKFIATPLGGSGGGRPTMAQAGGKTTEKLQETLDGVIGWIKSNLK
ncbi:MAG: alanine--tRNA ligase-related protein, partial [Anaerolineae bacterium]|nr:alanine--tRNA ligase-related protein [Anaerolineae bacterium]